MLSLNYENINYVMTQILKLSCASFSYVNISYVLAILKALAILSYFLLTSTNSARQTAGCQTGSPCLTPIHLPEATNILQTIIMPCYPNCDLRDLLLAKEDKTKLQQVMRWVDDLYH